MSRPFQQWDLVYTIREDPDRFYSAKDLCVYAIMSDPYYPDDSPSLSCDTLILFALESGLGEPIFPVGTPPMHSIDLATSYFTSIAYGRTRSSREALLLEAQESAGYDLYDNGETFDHVGPDAEIHLLDPHRLDAAFMHMYTHYTGRSYIAGRDPVVDHGRELFVDTMSAFFSRFELPPVANDVPGILP